MQLFSVARITSKAHEFYKKDEIFSYQLSSFCKNYNLISAWVLQKRRNGQKASYFCAWVQICEVFIWFGDNYEISFKSFITRSVVAPGTVENLAVKCEQI